MVSWTSKAAESVVGWMSGRLKHSCRQKKKKNTEGEAADNGDETPSKLCSSQ